MTRSIQQYLHDHIPLSRALGITVTRVTDEDAVLGAPLDPNLNHESNAFGGSISAVAILAGWTFLYGRLRDVTEARRIVIQRNHIEYLVPIRTDFEATCRAPDVTAWEKFFAVLLRKGKARVVLSVEITAAGERVATSEGTYVVMTTSRPVS